MGYTIHGFIAIDSASQEEKSQIVEFLNKEETRNGYKRPIAERFNVDAGMKWYDSDVDMALLSRQFPEKTFAFLWYGEEQDDTAYVLFRNGIKSPGGPIMDHWNLLLLLPLPPGPRNFPINVPELALLDAELDAFGTPHYAAVDALNESVKNGAITEEEAAKRLKELDDEFEKQLEKKREENYREKQEARRKAIFAQITALGYENISDLFESYFN